MLLYYSAKCLEVKENTYIIIASGNANNISLEKAPCIQRTSATKIIDQLYASCREEIREEETFTFFL